MKKLSSIVLLVIFSNVLEANISQAAQTYRLCAACHGIHAQTKALGLSHIIQGWNSEKILQALRGYKNGSSYGHSKMAWIMRDKTHNLSDEELQMLANYISKLK